MQYICIATNYKVSENTEQFMHLTMEILRNYMQIIHLITKIKFIENILELINLV